MPDDDAPHARTPRWLTLSMVAMALALTAAFWGARNNRRPTPIVEPAVASEPSPDVAPLPSIEEDVPSAAFSVPEVEATPAPAVAELPPESCPLSSKGFGAPPTSRVSPTWYRRGLDFETAQKEQAATGAPILLYVYTDWCRYCRAFEDGLLEHPDVDRFLQDAVIKVRINPESGPEDERVARMWHATRYPTLLLITENGGGRVGIYASGGGNTLKTPAEFVADLREVQLASVQEIWREAASARASGAPKRAVGLMDRVVSQAPDVPDAWTERGLALAESGDLEAGLDDLARASRLQPSSVKPYQAAEQVLGGQRRWLEAAACWALFQRQNPQDPAAEARRHRSLRRAAES